MVGGMGGRYAARLCRAKLNPSPAALSNSRDHPADVDIVRRCEKFRTCEMRRLRPQIGARKYALKATYSPRRAVCARPLRSVRPGGWWWLGGRGCLLQVP